MDIPGNSLDAFETEDNRARATASAPAPSLLTVVDAYPEEGLSPHHGLDSRPPPFRRHFVRSTVRAARTIAFFPLTVVAWFVLRIAWLIWWAAFGVWRALAGGAWLVNEGIGAIGRLVRDAALGAAHLLIAAVQAVARSVWNAVVFALNGLGAALAAASAAAVAVLRNSRRAVSRGVQVTAARIAATSRLVLDGGSRAVRACIAFAVAVVARTAALGRSGLAAVIGTGTAATRAVRGGVAAFTATTVTRSAAAVAAGVARVRHAWLSAKSAASAITLAATRRAGAVGALATALGRSGLAAGARTSAAAARAMSGGTRVAGRGLARLARGGRQGLGASVTACRILATAGSAACASGLRMAIRSVAALVTLIGSGLQSGASRWRRSSRGAARFAIRGVAAIAAWSKIAPLGRAAVADGIRLASQLRSDAPVIKLSITGAPPWARRVRLTPALSSVLAVTIGIAAGLAVFVPRQPDPRRAARAPAPAAGPVTRPRVVAAAAPAPAAPPARRRVERPTTAPPRAPITRPPSAPAQAAAAPHVSSVPLSAARVRAIWSETDTRSLDRALAALRNTTLAFQRCDMRVTADDQAVAHCDEARTAADSGAPAPRRVAWTIGFRRKNERWLIDEMTVPPR